MKLVAALVPLFCVLALYAGYIRLAARLKRASVSWGHSFAFALIVGGCALVGRLLSLPFLVGLILGLGVQVLGGGWFFRNRARNAQGEPLGWRPAVEMQVLATVFLLGTALVLSGLFRFLLLRLS